MMTHRIIPSFCGGSVECFSGHLVIFSEIWISCSTLIERFVCLVQMRINVVSPALKQVVLLEIVALCELLLFLLSLIV